MASNKPPGQKITGIRAPVPSGYLLGRVSKGIGDVELVTMAKAQSVGLIPTTLPPSGAAGGDLTGTYPNPTIAKLQGVTLTASAPTNLQVLMYHSSGTTWLPVTLAAVAYSGSYLDLTNLPPLTGGTTGQVLAKVSGTDYDFAWASTHYIPAGGTTGQVLTKNSGTDYDVSWATPSSGGGGASSFYLDGTHGYVAEVDSSGQLVLDSSGNAIYDTDPVLPLAMIPPGLPYSTALAFQAKLTSPQTVTTGTNNLCKPDTFVTNSLGAQYSTSTGKFTPTKAGLYLVFVTCQGQASGGDTITQVAGSVLKNGPSGTGTQICVGQAGPAPAAPAFSFVSTGLGVVSMNGTTDTLEMSARVDSSGVNTLVVSGAGNVTFGAFYMGQ